MTTADPAQHAAALQRAVPVLHAVTADDVVARPDFLDRARRVMRAMGARGALHLRTRLLPSADVHALARALADAQHETGAWLVLNDRVDLALAAGARGAQLTSRSIAVADARRVAPRLALGASVHDLGAARAAHAGGADWLVAGHVFDTASHPGAPGRGLAFLRAVAAAVPLPVIAIGGIRPGDLPTLRAGGAHGAAVIRGIWAAHDAEQAVIDYFSSYDADRDQPSRPPHRER